MPNLSVRQRAIVAAQTRGEEREEVRNRRLDDVIAVKDLNRHVPDVEKDNNSRRSEPVYHMSLCGTNPPLAILYTA